MGKIKYHTVKEVLKLMDCSRGTLYNWERAKKIPKARVAYFTDKIFAVDEGHLLIPDFVDEMRRSIKVRIYSAKGAISRI